MAETRTAWQFERPNEADAGGNRPVKVTLTVNTMGAAVQLVTVLSPEAFDAFVSDALKVLSGGIEVARAMPGEGG